MMRSLIFKNSLLTTVMTIGAFSWNASPAEAGPYVQTNLVSDIPGLATLTEPKLVNPWGVSHSGTARSGPRTREPAPPISSP